MQTTKIKGKDYVEVKERVAHLAETFAGDYSIQTDYNYYPERKMWVVKATLTIGSCVYTGHAQELESEDYRAVNHTSALENCETSAIGRACAAAGIGILTSYASADELRKAHARSDRSSTDKKEDQSLKQSYNVEIKAERPELDQEKYDAMRTAIKEGKIEAVKKGLAKYSMPEQWRKTIMADIADYIANPPQTAA